MSDAQTVDMAAAVLAAVVAHWPVVGEGDHPHLLEPPERRFVIVGTPVADCEQLSVGVERTFPNTGDPAIERITSASAGTPWTRAVVVAVQVLRCVTGNRGAGGVDTPQPPPPDTITAESYEQLTDADAVLEAMMDAYGAEDLAGCGGIAVEGWRAVTAAGGLSGGVTRFRLNLGF